MTGAGKQFVRVCAEQGKVPHHSNSPFRPCLGKTLTVPAIKDVCSYVLLPGCIVLMVVSGPTGLAGEFQLLAAVIYGQFYLRNLKLEILRNCFLPSKAFGCLEDQLERAPPVDKARSYLHLMLVALMDSGISVPIFFFFLPSHQCSQC